ncbi:MAG: hypothetical protein JSU87_07955 [Gemmatimonadota bacterium]|nr:MAG: hypothetical protein JSU87_07955 [Gemmatimonadota bacterium]
MRIEFLGSGGAITTPRPGCDCRICTEARHKGVPYSRSGPALFVHGPDLLFDTPEEIKDQLNRSGVRQIAGCFYSHWHPDHIMGRRVWEMNKDWRGWPPRNRRTDIYLPQQVAADFRTRLGSWEHLSFLEGEGLVRLIELRDEDSVSIGDTTVRPVRLAEDYVYAFLLSANGRRLFIAPDELLGWKPPTSLRALDLAVIPMGVLEYDPFSGERLLAEDHKLLKIESTFRENLQIARSLEAKRVVMTHIEEPDGLSYDDLLVLEKRLGDEGLDLSFAYDTMFIDV